MSYKIEIILDDCDDNTLKPMVEKAIQMGFDINGYTIVGCFGDMVTSVNMIKSNKI